MKLSRNVIVGIGLAASVIAVGAFGIASSDGSDDAGDQPAPVAGVAPSEVAAASGTPVVPAADLISRLQARLDEVPGDHVAWATLGFAYVQNARVTADSSYYPRADEALAQSLRLSPDDNYLAHAGLSTLAAARHDFVSAKEHAERGLEINSFNATLWGALSDAEVQLGNYDAADAAVERMLELSPDVASYSRASYLAELRGDVTLARSLMGDALDAAVRPSDRSFALTILGDLELGSGDPGAALTLYNEARSETPEDVNALHGKARAEAALGQNETALDHFAELVGRAPEPSFIIAYGTLLESLGYLDRAEEQYAVASDVQLLLVENGVELDAASLFFLADHGDPAEALAAAESAVAVRPFVEIHEALAWALHVNGRDAEAVAVIDEAIAVGVKDAGLHFRAGVIHAALGDEGAARAELGRALDIDPYFDPLDTPRANAMLDELGGGEDVGRDETSE